MADDGSPVRTGRLALDLAASRAPNDADPAAFDARSRQWAEENAAAIETFKAVLAKTWNARRRPVTLVIGRYDVLPDPAVFQNAQGLRRDECLR